VYWQGWQAPDNDDAAAGVIGYVVDRLPYDDTMAYAFGTIYPAISQKFAGHAILPSIPLDQAGSADSLFLRFLIEQASSDPTFYAQMLKRSHWREVQRRGISLRTINRQKQLIRDGHLYQHFLIETDPILATTMWIFNWMGLRVRKRDLRLILCWHWS